MFRILLYKTGETDPFLLPAIGDYEAWFSRLLGRDCTLEVHQAFVAPRQYLRGYDGMVISGSPRSLVEPEPWMDEAAAHIREAAATGLPILGVCFGHQLIAYAFGGEVRQNPNGWEVGTVEVELSDEGTRDSLFVGLPRRLRVNQSHRDEVARLGPTTRLLAGNGHSAHQAIAVGEQVRGVQFHPEINGAISRTIIAHRRQRLADDAARLGRADYSVDGLLTTVGDCPEAERVMSNFLQQFVRKAAARVA